MKILITGIAGFIGFSLAKKILENFDLVVYGIDNLNNYSNQIILKKERLRVLKTFKKNFNFHKIDLCDYKSLNSIFNNNKFDYVVNLGAMAGVRLSYDYPDEFFKSNIIGFYNLIEVSRINKIKHIVYASSSSVYGNCNSFPQNEKLNTDKQESFYAATKKNNEILAESYSKSYKIKMTGLRFFTVYGPYGREDMSFYNFCTSIINGKKLKLYNHGKHFRDFTYIDDVIDALIKVIFKSNTKRINKIYNVGYGKTNSLIKYLTLLSNELGIKPKIQKISLQNGDVFKTLSDISEIHKDFKFKPKVNLTLGIKKYVKWYKEFYQKN